MSERTHGAHQNLTDEIISLFHQRGGSQYGKEAVTQAEHALQAAFFAEREDAGPALIVAALLHDVGHLLHDLSDDAPELGIDDKHEALAADWLSGRFPPEVVAPVGLHVAAKRYLCAAEPEYYSQLSPPSILSLQLQGGPMSAAELEKFRAHKHFAGAVRLRRWDDAAKIVGLVTPTVEHFARYIDACAVPAT